MLIGFEELTKDLNDTEVKVIAPIISKAFHKKKLDGKVGKGYAVNNGSICEGVNRHCVKKGIKYKLNQIKLRKIIGYIRFSGMVHCLCSNSRGYYLASSKNELMDCVNSLRQRVRQQEAVADALYAQTFKM